MSFSIKFNPKIIFLIIFVNRKNSRHLYKMPAVWMNRMRLHDFGNQDVCVGYFGCFRLKCWTERFVPVVPHGTVTIVDALMEPSSPVEATVLLTRNLDDRTAGEQSQRECDVAAAVRFNVGIILN